MKPQLFGFTSYFVLWVVGAISGVGVATLQARRAGLPVWRSFLGVSAIAVTILVGSKILFLIEHALFLVDAPVPWQQSDVAQLARYGFRIPGGVLLVAAAMPLICWRLRLPTLRFADAVLPAVGVAIVFIRVGCFLNGCCFGRDTTFPLAVTFPPSATVYTWQAARGLIPPLAARTLPVHPLQLYFALQGMLLYLLGRRWQSRKRHDGQVYLNFYLLFFGGTLVLELLRPQPLHLNLILSTAVVVVAAIVGVRLRQAAPPAARVTA